MANNEIDNAIDESGLVVLGVRVGVDAGGLVDMLVLRDGVDGATHRGVPLPRSRPAPL